MRKYSELRSYQLRAIDYIIEKKRCGLALDMGLGKTISSLTAFVKLHNIEVKKLLIIAPLNVAKNVWHNEILNWEHTKHLTYSICIGTEKERLEALNKDVDVYIINQENIAWMYKKGFKKYGMIIVDESHCFKNHTSKRFRSLKKFTSKYIVLLSGTMMPKSYLDVWAQQFLIDKGESLGKTMSQYLHDYFLYNSRTYDYFCLYPDDIADCLKANWLSMKSEDYLELPDKILNNISVEIDNYHEYKKFEKEYLLKINDAEITAVNAAVLSNKLLQYCNGAIYDEYKNYIEIHNNKLDSLEQIIENYPEENILIAFNFKCDENRIKSKFKHAITLNSKNITEIEQKWNKKQIKLLLCQCSTAKGLNLQQGGRIIVWFGLTWNMENYKQFNARLHRQGQTKPVVIYHLVASKCMDERVLNVLQTKDLSQEELIKILKNEENI
jgi:SNF2 family DNA or RNA helicase